MLTGSLDITPQLAICLSQLAILSINILLGLIAFSYLAIPESECLFCLVELFGELVVAHNLSLRAFLIVQGISSLLITLATRLSYVLLQIT
jgi:hypothetical protein